MRHRLCGRAAAGIASVLQPFVDNHTLAGAVTLVASKDKVLDLEAVGYADIAAKKPMRTDCAVLDRLAVQADHRHGADDARGRRQGEAWTIRWRSTCRSSRARWSSAEQDTDHVLLQKPKHPITVRNVLSHTSGLPFNVADRSSRRSTCCRSRSACGATP